MRVLHRHCMALQLALQLALQFLTRPPPQR